MTLIRSNIYSLKYQTVQESSEDAFMNYQVSEQEHVSNGVPFGENQQQRKKTVSAVTYVLRLWNIVRR